MKETWQRMFARVKIPRVGQRTMKTVLVAALVVNFLFPTKEKEGEKDDIS